MKIISLMLSIAAIAASSAFASPPTYEVFVVLPGQTVDSQNFDVGVTNTDETEVILVTICTSEVAYYATITGGSMLVELGGSIDALISSRGDVTVDHAAEADDPNTAQVETTLGNTITITGDIGSSTQSSTSTHQISRSSSRT